MAKIALRKIVFVNFKGLKMSLASEIKKHAGTELAELLSELRHLRAKQAKGHNQKVVYMIDTTTQIGGKLHEAGCGFSPCFFGFVRVMLLP